MTCLRRATALAAVLLLLPAACSGQPEEESADAPEDDAATPAEPDDGEGVTLRLLTHDSFDVSEGVLEGFTADTGIEVEIVPVGDAGELVNQAVLTRDDPQGDVLFGVDSTFLTRALDEDLFLPYESPALEHVDEELVLDDEHRVTPVDRGDVCLNYDREWFADADVAVPTDLAQLAEDDYAGLLAVTNPATSSPGLAFLLASVERFGEDGWRDWWQQLRANDVLVTGGWSEAYYDEFSATGDGQRPLVVSYASSPPAEVLAAEEDLEQAPTGVVEESCFEQIEHAGILAGTEHEDEAARLVDFLLSESFQQDLPLTMFVFPVRADVEVPDVFARHAVLPDDPHRMDPERIGQHREEWIEAWTETVLR